VTGPDLIGHLSPDGSIWLWLASEVELAVFVALVIAFVLGQITQSIVLRITLRRPG
jgi:glycerol uptake facilitator-like aquaporin